ncbi:hypothetical protein FJZ48_04255 [Candidatus Uhrbacteria bacterium]|nr:hypothetical protein [Candidatus Uhrbacteria bacterium]
MTNPNSQIAKQLGSVGGKKSVEKRFAGKTKKEISELMRKVRTSALLKKSNPPKEVLDQMVKDSVESLNKSVLSE